MVDISQLMNESIKTDSGTRKPRRAVKAKYLLEDADNSGFSLVVDQIVNFVVAVDQGASILWLRHWISEERKNVIEVRNLTNRDSGLDVDSLGL